MKMFMTILALLVLAPLAGSMRSSKAESKAQVSEGLQLKAMAELRAQAREDMKDFGIEDGVDAKVDDDMDVGTVKYDTAEEKSEKDEDEKMEKKVAKSEKEDDAKMKKEDEEDEKDDEEEQKQDDEEDKEEQKKDDEEAEKETEKTNKLRKAVLEKLEANVTRIKKEIMDNSVERFHVTKELSELKDVNRTISRIDANVKVVANDTKSPALADFLGDMHKEMNMFGTPFYKEHLHEELEDLEKETKTLKKELAQAEKRVKSQERSWEKEDKEGAKEEDEKEEDEKVKASEDDEEEKEKKQALSKPETEHVPMFTKESMPEVSPTAHCVMCLTFQYFVIYTLLALIRTVNQFSNGRFARYQKLLDSMCSTVTYAPMLSVLFLATRMRAIQLSQGDTEKHELPQRWTQIAMYTATVCVLIQAIVTLATALLNPSATDPAGADADEDAWPLETQALSGSAKAVALIQTVNGNVLYAAVVVVIVGALSMQAPKELWGDAAPPVAPALVCTIILTVNFFAVYLGWAVCQTLNHLRGSTALTMKLEKLFELSKTSVNLAPMLCIMFIAARMRALQLDPVNGNPQSWAQTAFYACAFGVLVQSLMFLMPILDSTAKVARGPMRDEFVVLSDSRGLMIMSNVVRYVSLICIYVGAVVISYSILVIQAPGGLEMTPPVSPAVQCVVFLCNMYFFVYTLVFVGYTVQEFVNTTLVAKLLYIFEAGQHTVMFAPMLCMLFITARMRALQLTRTVDGKVPMEAGPQAWVQEAMYASSWAVFVQLVMSYILAVVFPPVERTVDNLKFEETSPSTARKCLGVFFDVINYLQMLAMYGGAVTVMVGIALMTPETLPPYAAREGLIPGLEIAPPPTVAPA